jgi:hypothetical protein
MADPNIEVNCPVCGVPIVYKRTTDDGTHVYVCLRHGTIIFPKDGVIRQQPV